MDSEISYRLCLYSQKKDGELLQEWQLEKGENIVGKKDDCSIFLNFDKISDVHAKITINTPNISLEDLDSKFGTYMHEPTLDQMHKLQKKRIYYIKLNQVFQISSYYFKIHTNQIFKQKKIEIPKSPKISFKKSIQNESIDLVPITEYFPNIIKDPQQAVPLPVQNKFITPPVQIRVLLSGFKLQNYEFQELKKLNIKVVNKQTDQYDYLVMERFVRSFKLLQSILLGKKILSKQFLINCIEKKNQIDVEDYLIECKEYEQKWEFNLQRSLAIGEEREIGVFKGKFFWIGNVQNKQKLANLIELGGGKVLERKNNNLKQDIIILVENPEEKKYHKDFIICLTEMIFISCLRQEFSPLDYILH